MSTTNCVICTEKFNKLSHAQVPCEYCEFIACRICCETYMKSEGICKCMNKDKKDGVHVCEKEWTRRHASAFMTKTFMSKEYKKMKEKRSMDVQKALLPGTMDVVKNEIDKERMLIEIQKLDQQILQIHAHKQQMYIAMRQHGTNKAVKEHSHYVRACPAESCRGYVNAQWKCQLCELSSCSDCHVVKQDNVCHICDPGQVATAQLLAKDTRQCPTCQEGIFKISGCDQMWCTQCRTAFDWKSGKIETVIHNPHYYQWLRANSAGGIPRTPGDMEEDDCGGGPDLVINHRFLDFIQLMTKSVTAKNKNREVLLLQDELDDIVRARNHLHYVQAPMYRTDRMNEDADQLALRVSFLRNKIDEDTFRIRTQRKEKEATKRNEMHDVMTLFHTATYDLIMRIYLLKPIIFKDNAWKFNPNDVGRFVDGFTEILSEVRCLVKHANDLLEEISRTYACTRKHLHIYGENKNKNNEVLVKF